MAGVQCRYCGCKDCRVTHTQKKQFRTRGIHYELVRRRRVCRNCGIPFFTVEHYEDPDEGLQPEPPTPPRAFNPYLDPPSSAPVLPDPLPPEEPTVQPPTHQFKPKGWTWNPPTES